MALAVAQSATGANSATDPKTCAFASNITAGSLLVMQTGATSDTTAVATVSDTRSNSWHFALRHFHAGSNTYVEIWYAVANSSGACTVSATFTGSVTTRISLIEVSGWVGTPTAHKTSTAGTASGTTHTFGALTTTVAEVYVVAAARTGSTFDAHTPTDSFAERMENPNDYIIDRILSGTATVQPSFTTVASEAFSLGMVAFAVESSGSLLLRRLMSEGLFVGRGGGL